jgi:hypothetical protein
MDLTSGTVSCVAGTALVFGLVFCAFTAALFLVRWIDQMQEGLEEEAGRE